MPPMPPFYPPAGGPPAPELQLPKGGYLRVEGHIQRFEGPDALTEARALHKRAGKDSARIHVYNAWHRRIAEAS